jgi:hypothetical protein
MTTIENNKLIAEFMGLRYRTDEWYSIDNNTEHFAVYANITKNEPDEELFRFHDDWNWLMEVKEKIENSIINGTLNGVIVTMGKNLNHKQYCYIEWGNTNNVRTGHRNLSGFYSKTIEENTLIEAVYNACIEFIKWYNENNPIN